MEEIGESATAWILRYIRNLRFKTKPEYNVDPLTAVELEQAEELWINTVQKELHERVKNKELNMLSPFTDDKGIIYTVNLKVLK